MRASAIIPALLLLAATACSPGLSGNPEEYVSTLTGSQSDFSFSSGNTYPAIALPWGMNFWTPQTGPKGDGWQYRYGDRAIRGFKQTHQPSPWINDYGCFSILPMADVDGPPESLFSHQSEIARPYYYQVYMADFDVNVEIAPSERGAVFRIDYPQSEENGFVLDSYGGSMRLLDSLTIVGSSNYNHGGTPDNFANFFVLKSDAPFVEHAREGSRLFLRFASSEGGKVHLRLASSFISEIQALRNLGEVSGSFDEVCAAAKARWNEVLGRIRVGGGSDGQYRTFYSCLYRSCLFPRKLWEIDAHGEIVHYSPYDGGVHKGYMYTDNGFWDTFRAEFPLLNLFYPDESAKMLAGLANVARENDFLPEWCSPGHRDCMVGNNSAAVIADAASKGLVAPADLKVLYDALVYGSSHVHSSVSSSGRLGHEYYDSLAYIPCDAGINESVARTLEYAYDDWCMLQIARQLGRPQEELERLEARSANWRKVFDPAVGLMRGRRSDGSFAPDFNPYKWGGDFTEGNSWHYSWSVFHDIPALIEAMGGPVNFEGKIDSVFSAPPVYDDSYYGFRIHEIAEMQAAGMGNYAHGNQPVQHLIYLYNYVGARHKTDSLVAEVLGRLYSSAPDGYCGDEDNGQTSAWYVLSALGFYPVCPASGEYALCKPLFPLVRLDGSLMSSPAGKRFWKKMLSHSEHAANNFLRYE